MSCGWHSSIAQPDAPLAGEADLAPQDRFLAIEVGARLAAGQTLSDSQSNVGESLSSLAINTTRLVAAGVGAADDPKPAGPAP